MISLFVEDEKLLIVSENGRGWMGEGCDLFLVFVMVCFYSGWCIVKMAASSRFVTLTTSSFAIGFLALAEKRIGILASEELEKQ